MFLPRSDVVSLSMTVEEGIKMVISGGVVTPPEPHPKTEKQEAPPVAASGGERG